MTTFEGCSDEVMYLLHLFVTEQFRSSHCETPQFILIHLRWVTSEKISENKTQGQKSLKWNNSWNFSCRNSSLIIESNWEKRVLTAFNAHLWRFTQCRALESDIPTKIKKPSFEENVSTFDQVLIRALSSLTSLTPQRRPGTLDVPGTQ